MWFIICSDEKQSAICQRIVVFPEYLFLHLLGEINHHIPADNQMASYRIGILQQVMLPEFHPGLDFVRNLVFCACLPEISPLQIRRYGRDAFLRIHALLGRLDDLSVQIRGMHPDIGQGQMPGHGHHKRVRFIPRGTGGAPYLQSLAESLNQFGNRLFLHHLPLVDIPVELRYIDGDVVDEFLEHPPVCPETEHIFVIALYPVLGNQIVDPALHLAFLVTAQVDSCQCQYFSFEILVIK